MSRRLSIAVVDDDEDDLQLIRSAFGDVSPSTSVHCLTDGKLLVDYLNSAVPPPDIVLLDLNMPKLNGYDILTMIRGDRALAPIPVIVFSTSDSKKGIVESYRRGANGYIKKPESYERLCEIASSIVHYWGSVCLLPKCHL